MVLWRLNCWGRTEDPAGTKRIDLRIEKEEDDEGAGDGRRVQRHTSIDMIRPVGEASDDGTPSGDVTKKIAQKVSLVSRDEQVTVVEEDVFRHLQVIMDHFKLRGGNSRTVRMNTDHDTLNKIVSWCHDHNRFGSAAHAQDIFHESSFEDIGVAISACHALKADLLLKQLAWLLNERWQNLSLPEQIIFTDLQKRRTSKATDKQRILQMSSVPRSPPLSARSSRCHAGAAPKEERTQSECKEGAALGRMRAAPPQSEGAASEFNGFMTEANGAAPRHRKAGALDFTSL